MSSYAARAMHPETGKVEPAIFIDDHYGPRQYGVRFADGKTFPRHQAREADGPPLTDAEAVSLFQELTTPEEFPAVHAMKP